MAVDSIYRAFSFPDYKNKFNSEYCEKRIEETKIHIIKPQTYMNNSGKSVLAASTFLKIHPSDILVIHDELDIPLGKMKFKKGGGHGGHNGLRSIDAHIGKDYMRLRMGIGRPDSKDMVTPFVLGNFAQNEVKFVEDMLETFLKHFHLIPSLEDDKFSSLISSQL